MMPSQERPSPPGAEGRVLGFATSRLHILAPDGVISRDDFNGLGEAVDVLAAARIEAERILREARAEALDLRGQAEREARVRMAQLEGELAARVALQQSAWLAQLQPTWLQALEQTVRRLCTTQLRTDALAGAIEAGARHFESLAGLRLGVHPDDADRAREALARVDLREPSIRVEADPELAPGSCRLRGRELELVFELDRAIDAVLGKA